MLEHWPSLLVWLLGIAAGAVLCWRALCRSDEPKSLVGRWLATLALLGILGCWAIRFFRGGSSGSLVGDFGAALLFVGGLVAGAMLVALLWGRHIGELVARPLSALFDGGGAELHPAPLYSLAIARRKQGKHEEALAELRRQLERFPGDFEGTLMVAEIQAEDLKDVPAAVATVARWLSEHPGDAGHETTALARLADWHLRVAHDTSEARRCLEGIVSQHPGSLTARMAEQRLAHLEYEAQPKAGSVRLPKGLGAPLETGVPPPPPADPSQSVEAAELVEQLKAHPHDLAARERLAQVYAWGLGQPALARTELETLIGFQRGSPREIARWLNLLADVEIQVAQDASAARLALQSLIDRNPASAAAEQARARLLFLNRELARHAPLHVVGARL